MKRVETFNWLPQISFVLMLAFPLIGNVQAMTDHLLDDVSTARNGVTLKQTQPPGSVLVLDSAVADPQILIDGLDPSIDVIRLQAGIDGLHQLAESLRGRSGLKTIHLISHGGPGNLRLGSATIDEQNLNRHADDLKILGEALARDGDILFYGCRIAEGQRGDTFLRRLRTLTGADIAASDNDTGFAALGGDWVLERSYGQVDSMPLLSAHSARYPHLLATYDFEGAAGTETSTVTTTVSGVTLTVTDPYSTFWLGDGGGFAGTSGTVLVGGRQTTNLTTFSFSSPVNLSTFRFACQSAVMNYTFTPVGGSGNSAVNVTSSTAGADINVNWNGITSFTVTENGDDGIFSDTLFDTFVFTTINTAPTIGGTSAGQTVNDNATLIPFSGVTISDADGDNVTTSVALDVNAKGIFTSASLTASGFTGSGPYTLASTTPASAQAAIRLLVFDPSDDRVAPGSTETTTFTITVNDGTVDGTDTTTTLVSTSINDAPVITSNGGGATGSTTINENTLAVTTVTATDPDPGETQTYSITGGVDQARFSINSSTGALSFSITPDFEAPADNGSDNVYNVQVTATDGHSATDSQDLSITIGNVNENPIITSNGGGTTASVNAAENQTAVTTVMAADQDSGDTLSFSITGGADAAQFSINSASGVLTFSSPPNYESPTDTGANNVYDVQVTVTDNGAGNLTDVQAIAVTVTNANEAPVITSNGGGATASTSVNENTTAVATVTATDVDSGDTLSFSISGGADAARFSINSASGALTFSSAPDYETPTDSGANNVYDVQVTVTDNGAGNLTDTQAIAVTVTNANDSPVITSDGGGASASLNAAENQTAVTTVTATDPDMADTLTYSLSGGADQALFSINSSTGVLVFASAPDFEAPTDSGANNVYDVQVTVTDNGTGNLTDVQAIAVTVTNANEAPVITSNGGGATASTSINENTTAVATVTATDVDSGDTLSFSISGGADAARFSINSASGALTFSSAPDYETPTDSGADNVYDVQVSATDNGTGNLSDTQAIAVTVTGVNEAPTISGTPPASASSGVPYTFTPSASDPDAGTTLTYAINTQPGWATFSTTTGRLSGTPAEGDVGSTTNGIVITVSDGSLSSTLPAFNLTVTQGTPGNQPPVISGSPATLVSGHTAYRFIPTATDSDNDPLTFSIVNRPAWARFDPATGELSGTPTNNDTGTTTGIVISVSDGSASASLSFDLTVTENLDIDGDGLPNDWELAHGLDPFDPSDAGGDLDGDGINNLDEYRASLDPNLDDNPPVVTPPDDITLDAVGLFTPVSLGTATAFDVLDGALTPSSDGVDYYRPGSHRITWRATDAAGNTGSAIQTVNVIPLVSFGKDQTTTEGAGVSVRVILNGSAVSYPVTVPYVLAGSAAVDGSDHDLTDGVATISSGLETRLEFTTLDDGPGEGAEQIVIAMETPINAVVGAHSIHTIQLLEGNVPPRVDLSADQGMGTTHTVVSEDGPVVISSQVTDPNPGDQHSYDWSATDSALSDLDTVVDRYTFDPSVLPPGLYTLRLTVSDGSASDTTAISLNVIAAAPELSSTQDSDGDGTDDASEGFGDSDNDGVADYLDAIASANVLQEQRGMNDNYLIEGEPSLRLQLGRVALQRDDGGAHVGIEEVQRFGGFDNDSQYDYPGGLFDFVIEEVPVIGQSVQIVVPQLAAIPANAVYRKAQSGGWRDFVVDEANSLASAPGTQGYCPPPGDIAYIEGLNEGYWCVQLTLEDGGPNDADGLANNAIEDPGGVATRISSTDSSSSSKGGGGGGIDLLLLWLLLSMMAFHTRVSKQNCVIASRRSSPLSRSAGHE